MNDNTNPLGELLVAKKKHLKKFKSLNAYIAHLKTLPSPDELLKQLEAKAQKKAEPIQYSAPEISSGKGDDPLNEIRAVKKQLQKKYKTVDAYVAHMKDIPSVDESLRQVREKIKKANASTQKGAVKHRNPRKSIASKTQTSQKKTKVSSKGQC